MRYEPDCGDNRSIFVAMTSTVTIMVDTKVPPIISNGLVEVAVYGCEIYPSTIFSYSVYKPVLVMKIAIILFTNL
jgi:hypothetical protein